MYLDINRVLSSNLEDYKRIYKGEITGIKLGLDVDDSVVSRYSLIRAIMDNGVFISKKSVTVYGNEFLTDLFVFQTDRTLYLILADAGLILSLRKTGDINKCLYELEEDIPLVFEDNVTVGSAKYSDGCNKTYVGIYIQFGLLGYSFLYHQLICILGQPTKDKRIEYAKLYYNGLFNVVVNHIDVPDDRDYYENFQYNKISNLELTISNLNSSSIYSKHGKPISSGTIEMCKLLDILGLSIAYSNDDAYIDEYGNIYVNDILVVRGDMIPKVLID